MARKSHAPRTRLLYPSMHRRDGSPREGGSARNDGKTRGTDRDAARTALPALPEVHPTPASAAADPHLYRERADAARNDPRAGRFNNQLRRGPRHAHDVRSPTASVDAG